MKFRLLFLLISLMTLSSCNQDENPIFKGAYSFLGSTCVFISCDGVPINIRTEGDVYKRLRRTYLAFELDDNSVLVTLKGKVLERLKLKNGKEILDIEATSLLKMEIGTNCAGEIVNY